MRGSGLAWLAFGAPMLVVASAPVAHDWQAYHNARFGTEAELPADVFASQSTPDNGDGAAWTSREGARVLVFGAWNVSERDPASQAAWLLRADRARYAHLSYKAARKGFLVLSGGFGDTIFYERYRFDDPSGAIHALVIEYPAERRAAYDPLVARMSASLRWTEPAY